MPSGSTKFGVKQRAYADRKVGGGLLSCLGLVAGGPRAPIAGRNGAKRKTPTGNEAVGVPLPERR